MIIVAGHLKIKTGRRGEAVERSQEAVAIARKTDGCLDFSVSPDPTDKRRVNVLERWRDRAALDAFRGSGPDDDFASLVGEFAVDEYDVPTPSDAESELRALLDERVRAVHAKDLTPLREAMAADVHTFNVLPPLQAAGADVLTEGARGWFAGYESDISYDVSDVDVTASGDLGAIRYVYRVRGTLVGGTDVDMTVRATLVCSREDGSWRIIHDHESVPWDPATGSVADANADAVDS